jgi:peptide/nickel transport system substrate-binding protein
MLSPRLTATLAGALVLSASLVACGGDSEPESGDQKYADGGTFTMALPSDPGNLDPSMTPSSVTRTMLPLAYDTLVYLEEDGTVVSGLAESWEATAKRASFTLKEGIACADGAELTATDVADNISYIADPENQSPLNGVMVHAGVKVTADDEARTVTVDSPDPNGFLLAELSGIFIICRAGLDDHDALATTTIGTGPWQLDEAVPDDHYAFTPTKGYAWGPDDTELTGAGAPDAVNVRIISDATTTANLLLSGEVNYAGVSGADTQRLASGDFETIDAVTTAGETWFNQADGRLAADPAVREALTLALDRDELASVATGGSGQESQGFITLDPNPCAGGDTVAGNLPDADPEQAAHVLDDAGWTVGDDGVRQRDGEPLSVEFVYDAQGLSSRTAGVELMTSRWKDLGVEVKVTTLPEAQLNERFFGTGQWDVAWASFTFNLPSQMVAFVSGPSPADGGANFPSIDNSDYDEAVTAATPQVGTDGCGDWARAEEALLAAFNLVPLFDDVSKTFVTGAELEAPGGQLWGTSIRMLQS